MYERNIILSPLESLTDENIYDFKRMYSDYLIELRKYSRLVPESVTDNEITEMIENKNINTCLVQSDKDIIGFVLVGTGENKHPLSDFFIQEFYIKKDYQGSGYGKAVFNEILKIFSIYYKRYNLYILNKNSKALFFWDKVAKENEYIDVSERYIVSFTPDDCIHKMYESEKFSRL